ncbi:MAG TPA: NAD-dependent epimerase/dehydratase family protein [Actinomycetota bacterium]|nr:NAD-dependent epimerase/dehydratase family protein [Actinomycetota bacterium]
MNDDANVLVTGGCGFIGANLLRFLSERTDWRLRVVDDLRTGRTEYLPDGVADVRIGDAGDASILGPALEDVDAVIHLASQTGVGPSVENPAADFAGNTATTFGVLDACRERSIGRVVFASSGAAVGEVTPPIHEEVVPRPVSPYGASKLAGEAYCRAFAASFGMQTVALRFSNVYGPFSAHKSNAVPNFIKHGITGEPIEIYGDGGQTRDFIFVEDLCDALRRAVVTDGIGGEVFQVATGVETSIRELAETCQAVVGGPNEIRFGEARPGEVYKSSVEISKIRRVLGFEPEVSLRDGLARTAEWYRQHWSPQQG